MIDVESFIQDYKLILPRVIPKVKDIDNGRGKIYSIYICSVLTKIFKSIKGVVN